MLDQTGLNQVNNNTLPQPQYASFDNRGMPSVMLAACGSLWRCSSAAALAATLRLQQSRVRSLCVTVALAHRCVRCRRLHMLHDIAAGMAYLHSRNYMHGDLRTPNVFVATDGHAKIGDFGFAR